MGEAAPSNPSPKSYYSMDCEYRAHAAIFLARQEAACDPFGALNLSVDKFHLREHVQHPTSGSDISLKILHPSGHPRGQDFLGKKNGGQPRNNYFRIFAREFFMIALSFFLKIL